MKETSGNMTIQLLIECPYCDCENDLFEDSNLTDDGTIYEELLSDDNFGRTSKNLETACVECKEEFSVKTNW